jgi:hypothetical protein
VSEKANLNFRVIVLATRKPDQKIISFFKECTKNTVAVIFMKNIHTADKHANMHPIELGATPLIDFYMILDLLC